jgi:two-component system, OmpR family, alkaline phosphatase synthesis response regulator PhoP
VKRVILIVEDDLELQELYTMMLESLDFELVRALDGREALDKLARRLPDLVILDILLDKVMGNEVFRLMRQEPRYAGVPVIVVSVLSADRCEDLIEMDGRTSFLRKPFRREDLMAAVRKALPDE